jgi:pyridoxine 5'-phosphate synthase PdxJ
MSRITIDLEPLSTLYRESSDLTRAIVRNALSCEIAGADSVLIGMGNDNDQRRRKLISLLVDSLNINLAVKSGLDDRSLEALAEMKPAMVIFPYQAERKDLLTNAVTNLQVEGILVGLEIPLNIEHIKDAARLKSDYVILNCEPYCSARNMNARLDEMNNVVKLASLSARLSMGVIAAGDFSPGLLSKLNGAVHIEEYVVGLHFFTSSLIHGYGKALDIIRFSLS